MRFILKKYKQIDDIVKPTFLGLLVILNEKRELQTALLLRQANEEEEKRR